MDNGDRKKPPDVRAVFCPHSESNGPALSVVDEERYNG
jgi:hypothetical protein